MHRRFWKIGPSIPDALSNWGIGWRCGCATGLVKAILAVEPNGPPFNVETFPRMVSRAPQARSGVSCAPPRIPNSGEGRDLAIVQQETPVDGSCCWLQRWRERCRIFRRPIRS